jgi:hypothetical protein
VSKYQARSPFSRLAPSCGWVLLVAVDAVAFVGAESIDASLRTDSNSLTLIHISALLSVVQLKARTTVAVIAFWGVHAQLVAASIICSSLIDSTALLGFVLPAPAIVRPVANLPEWQTHLSIPKAVKLSCAVAREDRACAASLVAVVGTLWMTRALGRGWDTPFSISASKLIRLASQLRSAPGGHSSAGPDTGTHCGSKPVLNLPAAPCSLSHLPPQGNLRHRRKPRSRRCKSRWHT